MAVREWKQPPDAKAEIIDLQLLMCASSLARVGVGVRVRVRVEVRVRIRVEVRAGV
jgi:hypothetical protein